jgi:hypothetical protein
MVNVPVITGGGTPDSDGGLRVPERLPPLSLVLSFQHVRVTDAIPRVSESRARPRD